MTDNLAGDLGVILRLCLAVVALYGVYRHMLVPTFNEEFRQRIFELRRELFMMGVDGEMSFTAPAYEDARMFMNGMLRFAEIFTFTRMGFNMAPRAEDDEILRRHRANLAELPEGVREKVFRLQAATFTAALKRAIITSLPALIVTAGICIVIYSRRLLGDKKASSGKEEVANMFPRDPVISEAIALDAAA